MKFLIKYSIGCSFVLLMLMGWANAAPSSKVTVKVSDEGHQPVINAEVEVWYHIGNKQTTNKGKSGDKGEFVATGEGMLPQLTVYSRTQGYYESCVIYKFAKKSLLNRWEPWNPTIEVVLKKKRNQVAMFDSHRTGYKVPKLNTPIGFDLEKEDWVAPYGTGLTADFIITFNAEIRAYADYDCGFSLKFSNPNDGIQEYFSDTKDQSSFKWPYEAPTNGYISEISKQKNMLLGATGYKSNERENANYIFRLRTKVDKNGNIVDARYGKISGEFGFVPSGEITFRYFLNPDGTRNLEEDPKKNLFNKK
jgi:hypothetical protein